jgi:hypothetical protein
MRQHGEIALCLSSFLVVCTGLATCGWLAWLLGGRDAWVGWALAFLFIFLGSIAVITALVSGALALLRGHREHVFSFVVASISILAIAVEYVIMVVVPSHLAPLP